MFYAIAAPENVAKVEAAFREELARLLKDGVGIGRTQGRDRRPAEGSSTQPR
ncbi:MAG: insulinase family protein [Chiayiivirga sp.]|jgi:hypothetical protein|nr:insulinase family protein [Chiayiivirga sp.]